MDDKTNNNNTASESDRIFEAEGLDEALCDEGGASGLSSSSEARMVESVMVALTFSLLGFIALLLWEVPVSFAL